MKTKPTILLKILIVFSQWLTEQGDRKSLKNVKLNNINRLDLPDSNRTPFIQHTQREISQVLLKWSIHQNKLLSVEDNQTQSI